MKALDLFCGAGGVTKGLQLAGYHVTGVDLVASPRYCGDAFIQGDARDVDLQDFDFIWASPVCKRYSAGSKHAGTSDRHPDQIPWVRERLERAGVPYAIENVVGAPLRRDLVLCGSMFGLGVRRHRVFELSFSAPKPPACDHSKPAVPVYGNGTPSYHWRRGLSFSQADKSAAMGVDWMTRDELSQAIPPAYAEFIGRAAAREWLAKRAA
jgi:DNA (cytosine-5)-methyltransferase 1